MDEERQAFYNYEEEDNSDDGNTGTNINELETPETNEEETGIIQEIITEKKSKLLIKIKIFSSFFKIFVRFY